MEMGDSFAAALPSARRNQVGRGDLASAGDLLLEGRRSQLPAARVPVGLSPGLGFSALQG